MARKKKDAGQESAPSTTDTTEVNPMSTETTIDLNSMPSEVDTQVEAEAKNSSAGKKSVRVHGEKITGQELLDFAKANQEMPAEDLAYGAGYYTEVTDVQSGEITILRHTKNFFRALTEASTGIPFVSVKRPYSSRKGRAPVITVGDLGNCVVGARHTSVAGFAPGAKVLVTSEAGKIVLTQHEPAPGSEADIAQKAKSEGDFDL